MFSCGEIDIDHVVRQWAVSNVPDECAVCGFGWQAAEPVFRDRVLARWEVPGQELPCAPRQDGLNPATSSKDPDGPTSVEP
jgi:hypothetical protein